MSPRKKPKVSLIPCASRCQPTFASIASVGVRRDARKQGKKAAWNDIRLVPAGSPWGVGSGGCHGAHRHHCHRSKILRETKRIPLS